MVTPSSQAAVPLPPPVPGAWRGTLGPCQLPGPGSGGRGPGKHGHCSAVLFLESSLYLSFLYVIMYKFSISYIDYFLPCNL